MAWETVWLRVSDLKKRQPVSRLLDCVKTRASVDQEHTYYGEKQYARLYLTNDY